MPRKPAKLKAVNAALQAVATAEVRLREAIIAAYADRDGYTVADIAHEAGVSRERVHQIVKAQLADPLQPIRERSAPGFTMEEER